MPTPKGTKFRVTTQRGCKNDHVDHSERPHPQLEEINIAIFNTKGEGSDEMKGIRILTLAVNELIKAHNTTNKTK